jgi:hypothetical protein
MPTGQGCGGIRDIASCAEIVARVVDEARKTIERLGGLVGPAGARAPTAG